MCIDAARAQQATENVTLAPIECWTRTSTSAVRVGERFDLVLTCAVVETESTTVVPDQSRLDPGVLQVPPFEVVSGSQAADLRTRTHRLFQYDYVLRYLGEQIGGDIELPGATISYRVQSRMQGDAAVESRDRQYILPSTRIHVASLVPAAAKDIHDALPPTFRAIEERRFRATFLRIVSWVVLGVGGVMVAWALAALIRRPREAGAVARRVAREAAVLRAASRELEQVRRQRQVDGWTADLAARALAALRLAGSYTLGRPVAQTPAAAGTPPAPGQLRVPSILPGRRGMIVSGSATPEAVALQLRHAERAGARVDERLRDLQVALERLGAAAYGRNGVASDSTLDEALERGNRALRHVARRYTWPARAARAARQSVTEVRDRAWAR
ncbi:MAG TPA: hypothetical protein VIX63_11995 [Vicinamibacterales bacterium]